MFIAGNLIKPLDGAKRFGLPSRGPKIYAKIQLFFLVISPGSREEVKKKNAARIEIESELARWSGIRSFRLRPEVWDAGRLARIKTL